MASMEPKGVPSCRSGELARQQTAEQLDVRYLSERPIKCLSVIVRNAADARCREYMVG